VHAAVRLLYAVAVALFLVLTVAFGTLTFYPSQDAPSYPIEPAIARPVGPGSPATVTPDEAARQQEAQREYDRLYREYEDDRAIHSRNVLLVATAVAAAVIIAGVAATAALDVLRVGVMLGGLLTVLWALIYGAADADTGTLFVAALVVLVLLGAVSQPRVRDWIARALRLGPGEDLLGR